MSGATKKFLFINRKAPYGTIYAWESLEVVLIGAAFEQDVSLAFMDDGVYELVKGQDTAGIGMKLTPATEPHYDSTCQNTENDFSNDRGNTERRTMTSSDITPIQQGRIISPR